jgi:sugar (pentulose or hexulose) kinase
MVFAAIDVGGTYVKSGLVDPDTGETTSLCRTPTPYSRSARSADVLDVDPLLSIVRGEAERLVAAGAHAVLISNQMHGLVMVDDSLEHLSPLYTWQADPAAALPNGSAGLIARLSKQLGVSGRLALGNELRQGLPIVTLAALVETQGRLPLGATLLSVGDFVTSRLCGGVTTCHVTNAAASGMFDVFAGVWSIDAIEAAGAGRVKMPEVCEKPMAVGHMEAAGLRVPVMCAIGDQQASLVGANLAYEELSVNIATGCQVSRRTTKPDPTAPQVRPYVWGDYLATVTHIPAGRALNAFVRLLANASLDDDLVDEWSWLEAAAMDADAAGIEANVAVFPAAKGYPGSLAGLTEENMTPGSVFRAAMESVAKRIGEAADAVGAAGLSRIVFSGGVAFRSDLMRAEVADRIELPYRVVDEDADALTGLARIGVSVFEA